MYRRIQLIWHHIPQTRYEMPESWYMQGLMGISIFESDWGEKLRGPKRRSFPTNARFFFTEKGWKEVGRDIIRRAQEAGQEYKIISIKETDAQVVWQDKYTGYEVAVQPKRRKNNGRS